MRGTPVKAHNDLTGCLIFALFLAQGRKTTVPLARKRRLPHSW